jgi:hypothetical protein
MRIFNAPCALAVVPQLMVHAKLYHARHVEIQESEHLEDFVKRTVEAGVGYKLYDLRSLARFIDIALLRGCPLPLDLDRLMKFPITNTPAQRLHRVWRRVLFELEAQP